MESRDRLLAHAAKLTELAREFHAALAREIEQHRELFAAARRECNAAGLRTPWSWCLAGDCRSDDFVARAGAVVRAALEEERRQANRAFSIAEGERRAAAAPVQRAPVTADRASDRRI